MRIHTALFTIALATVPGTLGYLAAAKVPPPVEQRLEHRYPLPDWADQDLSWLSDASAFDDSRALCTSLKDRTPPPQDWPLLSEVPALAGCNSLALYHGLDGPRDLTKARHCALLERENMGRGEPLAGSSALRGPAVLAMIYANGAAVERDLALATHMACEINGAAAEVNSRIMRLEVKRREGWGGYDFDPCDDMTSGTGTAACLQLATRLDERDIAARLTMLTADWPASQQQALTELRSAFAAYATQANAMNGAGAGGGWAEVWQVSGANAMQGQFLRQLLALVAHQPVAQEERLDEDERPWARVATMSAAQWLDMLDGLIPTDRPRFVQHRNATIAARQAFEPRLVAFMRLARPDLTAHQVRVLFRAL